MAVLSEIDPSLFWAFAAIGVTFLFWGYDKLGSVFDKKHEKIVNVIVGLLSFAIGLVILLKIFGIF